MTIALLFLGIVYSIVWVSILSYMDSDIRELEACYVVDSLSWRDFKTAPKSILAKHSCL